MCFLGKSPSMYTNRCGRGVGEHSPVLVDVIIFQSHVSKVFHFSGKRTFGVTFVFVGCTGCGKLILKYSILDTIYLAEERIHWLCHVNMLTDHPFP
jgi:hypothetical protein